MVFQLLLLPTEVIDTVAGNLTQTEAPRLALTCKRLYDLCIGYCYQSVLVASTRLDTISLSLQESSMRRMDRLLSDSRKRNGIRELKIRSIGVRSVLIDLPDRVIPEPFLTAFREERIEWNEHQPAFIKRARNLLFSTDSTFPRLKNLLYDSSSLMTEADTHRFLSFLKRHPRVQNVIVQDHHHHPHPPLTKTLGPRTVDLCLLRQVAIFGPFLPLLLGFRFVVPASPSAGNRNHHHHHRYGPLQTPDTGPRTLPFLTRVHLSWPQQRTVRMPSHHHHHSARESGTIDLDLMDVLKALASVCKHTLRLLQIDVAGPAGIDVEVIEYVTANFPELREFNVCPAEEFLLTDQVVLMWMAEELNKLKHLERFMYSVPNAIEEVGYYSTLGSYIHNPGPWDAVSVHFARHCASLKSLALCALVWKRVLKIHPGPPPTVENLGFELIMTM